MEQLIIKKWEYQNLYNMQNALLLLAVAADLKIDMKGKSYLETLNFVTLLWLSLECALKITGTEYEILTNMNMMLDYENGVRGGITTVLCHFTKTQNKYVNDYDKQKKAHIFHILILTTNMDTLYQQNFLTRARIMLRYINIYNGLLGLILKNKGMRVV